MARHKAKEIKDGKEYVSVTTALGIIRMPLLEMWRGKHGNQVCQQIINESLKVGKQFHEYASMIDEGRGYEIDIEALEEPVKSMVEKFREWFFENVEKVILTEEKFFHDTYLYKGQIDAVYLLKGRKVPDVFDRKTGKYIDRKDGYQLAAYKEMLKSNDIKTNSRIILHCSKEGTFKVIVLDSSEHESDFQAFLNAKDLYLDYKK